MKESMDLYLEIGQSFSDSEQSQMFGKSCFKTNKKAFVCFFQDEMVFKLTGDDHKKALSYDGSTLFDPSGKKRPMKEWVQVPYKYYDQWADFAEAAKNYVESK